MNQRLGLESQQDYRQRMSDAQVHALVALALVASHTLLEPLA